MATYNPKRKTSSGTEDVKFPISAVDGLQDAIDGKADSHSHPYLPLAGGTMNNNAAIKLTKYGNRYITIDGNSIAVDMSNCTGGWAGNFASVKDPSGTTTAMLGWYGGASGLTHIFMGGTYSDPALKMTPAGVFTFKTAPRIGNETIATLEELDVLEAAIVDGDVIAGEATYAQNAATADQASYADEAVYAKYAIYDDNEQEIHTTYATKNEVSTTYATKQDVTDVVNSLVGGDIIVDEATRAECATCDINGNDIHTTYATTSEGTFFVEGTGTTDSTAKTSTWTGASDRITEYYDGLTIRYKIGVAGQNTVTLNINDLGAKTVYRFNTTKLTTHFPVGSIITLIYHSDLNGGCWITNDYDSNTNTYQRVYESSAKNVEYPITARYNTTTGSSYYAEYGRYSTGVTLNPSTKTITASTFKGALSGNADTATKATKDGSGNIITDTYATKGDLDGLKMYLTDGSLDYDTILTVVRAEQDANGNVITDTYATKADLESIGNQGGSSFEMPQIRFCNVNYTDKTQVVDVDHPMTLTVEIVGGGALQVGDKLQICARRKCSDARYSDANSVWYHKSKWKLRMMEEYEITADDLEKRFLNIQTYGNGGKANWLFHNDRAGNTEDSLSAFYMRIKRVTKRGTDGMENDAIFSNVLTLWKTYNWNTNRVTIK